MRTLYAFVGALVGAVTDLLINLLAAALQQRAFGDQFSQRSLGWLVGLVLVGLLLGLYLGKVLELPVAEQAPTSAVPAKKRSKAQNIKITRLRAILSYNRLRGQGIELGDILSIGSVVTIDAD